MVFFDGASQQRAILCGAGAAIDLSSSDIFLIKLELGVGTNTKEEVLALWMVLFYGKNLNLYQLQVVGNAKIVFG